MAEFKLDRFKYTWKGQWSNGTTYLRDDVVGYGAGSFVCVVAHTAAGLFSTDLNNQDSANSEPAPRWVKMTDGTAWRDQWTTSSVYDPGDVVAYGGNLYLCVESHASSSVFDNDISRWIVRNVQIAWNQDWAASTQYGVNDVVRYGGLVYRCVQGHASADVDSGLEQDQDKWTIYNLGEEYLGDWTIGSRYRVGDLVKFGGSVYRCKQQHSPLDDSTINFDQDAFWEIKFPGYQFRGEWNNDTTYRIGDVARNGGWLFYSLTDNYNSHPVSSIYQLVDRTDPLDWEIVSKGINFRGEWNIDETYKTGDVVRRGGGIYVALLDTEATADGSSLDYLDDSNWELLNQGQNFKSNWTEDEDYAVGDVVVFFGTAFVCKLGHVSDTVNFPTEDIAAAGTGFQFWDILVEKGSEYGLQYRGDLLTYDLKRDFYGDDSSFGLTNVRQGQKDQLVIINDNDAVIYKSYGQVNRVVYVSIDGIDDVTPIVSNNNAIDANNSEISQTFVVRSVPNPNGVGAIYEINGVNRPVLNLVRGGVYTFDQSDVSNINHPLRIRDSEDNSWTVGVVATGTPGNAGAQTVFTVPNTAPNDLRYYCTVHGNGMGNVIAITGEGYSGIDNTSRSLRGLSANYPWRTVKFACEQVDDGFQGTTTVRVRTGRFKETLPIIVPARTAVVGDELRSTTIVAAGPDQSLALDSTYTIAALTRISQVIQATIAGVALDPAKTPSNTLNPVVLTRSVSVSFDPPRFTDGDSFLGISPTEIFDLQEITLETDPQAAADVQTLISNIINYINFFVNSSGVNPSLIGTNQAIVNQEYLNAVQVLLANKEFLAAEAVAFVKLTFPLYVFDEEFYRNNIRRLVDAWSYDITYTGNYKSLLEARYYTNAVLGSKLEDMFYVRDTTGIRNLTMAGLDGRLNPPNVNDIYRLPTGGAYVSLDPGWGPDDDRTWIIDRSPYIQNVTTLGRGSVGQKIDGALHNGGNRSITSNDFTQVIDEGIGAWVLNQGRAELVSVFSYYAHISYLATNGGIIRATNGNSSYGTFGAVADGNDPTEIPQTGTVNNRNQHASATVFAGDFTDEIQILEWTNAGQDYTQAAASFLGAGANAAVTFEEFRDNAVQNVIITDISTTILQNIGGGGYLRVQNNAQVQEIQDNDLTSIRIASNDANAQIDYLGSRIIITGGPGTGQYGYITAYNTASKVVSVSRESDNQPGWDHVVPGTPVANPLTSSTAYRIEPRPVFSAPAYISEQYGIGLNTNWGAVVYGETTETYSDIAGQAGTGSVEGQDGLVPVTATFNIDKIGRAYTVTVNNGGAGYRINDEILILGTQLGGISPYNDLSITVIAITDDSTNSITDIATVGQAASGKFVAITEGGSAGLYSNDGAGWPDGFNMPSVGDWTCLAAGNNRFVAIRTGSNAAASSLNGITWTARTMPANRSWQAVAYGGDRFVAIASDQNSAAYSTNGTTWTAATMPTVGDSTLNEWKDITYGRGRFVAVANSQNVAAYSADGISWTGVVMADTVPRDWVSVAYGNNRYVVVASTGELLYSFDAETWRTASLPATSGIKWRKIRYAQGVFFALAESQNNTPTNVAATSPDGIVWTARELAAAATWKDIAFGNPYIELFDSTVGKSTPVWSAISTSNITSRIRTGARAMGKVDVNAGVISSVKLWDTGSGYDNEPILTLVSPTSTSDAAFQCRLADGVLTNPTWNNRGIGYRTGTTRVTVTGNGAADVIPVGKFLTLENLSKIPGPGAQVFFAGNSTRYTIVTLQPISTMLNGASGVLVRVTPELRVRDNLEHGTTISIREQYSQLRLTGHDFLDIGTGNFQQTNYPDLYSRLFFSAPEDEVREENGGRVFYTSTDQSGNFRTGELFAVEQSTGIVTISADFFDLGGLEEIRLGGIRVGGSGAVIREFTTDPTFTEDSNNIVPTQRAIRSFLTNRLSLGGSEIATFQIQAGQVFLGGPDRISNALGLKIVIPVMADFSGAGSGVSGAMLAQSMFYRSFNN